MDIQQIDRIRGVVAKTIHRRIEEVTLSSTFMDLGMDSMDAVELAFALEEEFDISIPDGKVRSVASIQQLVDGVESLITAKDFTAQSSSDRSGDA